MSPEPSPPDRPNPDRLLADWQQATARSRRGRLRIFFGMCPGVGKTYAMLRAARERWGEGLDVVVGVVETHGRAETEALLQGLEVLPRVEISHRGAVLRELDLDGLLRRRPRLAVVDELAHHNAPGSRHPKRYLDVRELLQAGLDVYTTLNVQHLESRADAVEALAEVPVRERVPDAILQEADEIEVVDLSPGELRRRLGEGKVYAGAVAAEAAERFFRERNLVALREMTLRSSAERVNRNLLDLLRAEGDRDPARGGERLLVAVGPSPFSERLVRWTCRFASALAATWVAVTVEPPEPLDAESRERLERHLALARRLGAEVVLTSGVDVAEAILRTARREMVTQIVAGRSVLPFWRRVWGGPTLTDRLIRSSGGLDVHIVPAPQERRTIEWRRLVAPSAGFPWADAARGLGAVTVLTALLWPLREWTGYWTPGLVYFALIVLGGLTLSRTAVLLVGALCAALWNFLFIPPIFTFHIERLPDALLFGLYFLTALAMGRLTARLRSAREAERAREIRSTALLRFLQTLTGRGSLRESLPEALRLLEEIFQAPAALWLARDEGGETHPASAGFTPKEHGVIDWVRRNRQPAGCGTDSLPELASLYLPVPCADGAGGVLRLATSGRRLSLAAGDLLQAMCAQLGRASEREALARVALQAHLLEESHRLQKTLLDGVSHELKTPLTVIQTGIEQARLRLPPEAGGPAREVLDMVSASAARLLRTVNLLLDLTRAESGTFQPRREPVDLAGLLDSLAARAARPGDGPGLTVNRPDRLPPVWSDEGLLQQLLSLLVDNALVHTPPGTRIEVCATFAGDWLRVVVEDDGPGFATSDPEALFAPFQRGDPRRPGGLGLGLSVARRLAEALGGTLRAESRAPRGARFLLEMPARAVEIGE